MSQTRSGRMDLEFFISDFNLSWGEIPYPSSRSHLLGNLIRRMKNFLHLKILDHNIIFYFSFYIVWQWNKSFYDHLNHWATGTCLLSSARIKWQELQDMEISGLWCGCDMNICVLYTNIHWNLISNRRTFKRGALGRH